MTCYGHQKWHWQYTHSHCPDSGKCCLLDSSATDRTPSPGTSCPCSHVDTHICNTTAQTEWLSHLTSTCTAYIPPKRFITLTWFHDLPQSVEANLVYYPNENITTSFQTIPGSKGDLRLVIFTENFFGFPQFFQANCGIIP